jgi:hydrogenase-4 component B
VPVWDGGILAFREAMQYTATTYANPTRVTFDELYRPEFHLERASDDPAGRSGPVHYRFHVLPIFERFLYRPIVRAVERLAVALEGAELISYRKAPR